MSDTIQLSVSQCQRAFCLQHCNTILFLKPLLNNKILESAILKALADDKIFFFLKCPELSLIIVEKGKMLFILYQMKKS